MVFGLGEWSRLSPLIIFNDWINLVVKLTLYIVSLIF